MSRERSSRRTRPGREERPPPSAEIAAGDAPDTADSRRDADVLLDVPRLEVGKIELEVQNLEAHVSLNTEVAGMVELRAGVHVQLDRVQATVEEVEVAAHLRVHLERVADVLSRVFDSIDQNADVLSEVMLKRIEERGGRIEDGASQTETES